MRQRVLRSPIRYKQVWRSFRSLLSISLLTIYAVGAIGIDLLHHSIHTHQDAEVHSSIMEKDPCHRSIFHGDVKNGCHHKAHLTSTENCKFSHVVFQVQQELTHDHALITVTERNQVIFGYYASLPSTSLKQPRLRGPPVV